MRKPISSPRKASSRSAVSNFEHVIGRPPEDLEIAACAAELPPQRKKRHPASRQTRIRVHPGARTREGRRLCRRRRAGRAVATSSVNGSINITQGFNIFTGHCRRTGAAASSSSSVIQGSAERADLSGRCGGSGGAPGQGVSRPGPARRSTIPTARCATPSRTAWAKLRGRRKPPSRPTRRQVNANEIAFEA